MKTFFVSAARALVAASLLLGTVTAVAQEVQVSEKAREHFRTGVAYLQDPDGARYEEAYREFKAAYADSPSWKILGNLGISAMKLERDGEAVTSFETYLKDGGDQIDPSEREQMERDLNTTKTGLVWVTMSSNPPGAYFVDERMPVAGRPVLNQYDAMQEPQKVGIRRGRHRITAKLDGYVDNVWEFDANPGEEVTHVFEMEKPKEQPVVTGGGTTGPVDTGPVMERPVPVPVYITGGVAVACLAGAGVTGIMAMGKKSDFDDANDGTDSAAAQDLRDSGTTLNLVSDILLGAGVVAGVVTVILYANRPEVPVEQDTAALRFVPVVGPKGGALTMTGAF